MLDRFFKKITFIGDGYFYAIFVYILLFIDYFYLVLSISSILITTIIVQYLKLVLFHYEHRPLEYFKDYPNVTYHLTEGIEMSYFNSFPSGHTTTGFVMCTILALLFANRFLAIRPWLQLVFFALGLTIGISRIYLMQHFFVDTYAGTFIATSTVLVLYFLFQKLGLFTKLQSKSLLSN